MSSIRTGRLGDVPLMLLCDDGALLTAFAAWVHKWFWWFPDPMPGPAPLMVRIDPGHPMPEPGPPVHRSDRVEVWRTDFGYLIRSGARWLDARPAAGTATGIIASPFDAEMFAWALALLLHKRGCFALPATQEGTGLSPGGALGEASVLLREDSGIVESISFRRDATGGGSVAVPQTLRFATPVTAAEALHRLAEDSPGTMAETRVSAQQAKILSALVAQCGIVGSR